MSTRFFVFVVWTVLAVAATAQVGPPPSGRLKKGEARPVFSPTDEPAHKPESKPATPPTTAEGAAEAADPIDSLLGRLARWPAKPAKDAALALSGLGDKVEARLIGGLTSNDWRVQAGSACALGEMRSKAAITPLITAIREPSNGAALSELMASLIRIDPVEGPRHIFPFLTHQSGRVRQAAQVALPSVLDPQYLPELVNLFHSRAPATRAIAVELMTRIPDSAGREEFFDALADPEVGVSSPAARHLALHGHDAEYKRLLTLLREGNTRQAAYAMVALTLAEDARGQTLLPEGEGVRDRALRMLQGDDPFYRGSAAVALANMSFRTDDATLRAVADQYLMPILLDTVAGGSFFNDYVAVEDLAYRKMELLSGEAYGPTSTRWRAYWKRVEGKFVARRQLRMVTAADLARCTLQIRVEGAPGGDRTAFFTGDPAVLDRDLPGQPLVLSERDRDTVKKALDAALFFANRGEVKDSSRTEPMIEIGLRRGPDEFVRRHYGKFPPEIDALEKTLFDLRRSLAWQRFAPSDAALRAKYFADNAEFFRTSTEAAQNDRLLAIALDNYATFDASGKLAASDLFSVSTPEFRTRNSDRLLALLKGEPALTDQAARLIEVLSVVDAVPVREEVLTFLGAKPGLRTADVTKEYLAHQPRTNVIAALRSESATIRASAAEALLKFRGDSEVVGVLIDGLKDYEPRVRDACVRTLAGFDDPRVPAMIEAVIAGPEKPLRVRAIEALGIVGREQSVPRLMEIFRDGDVHDRYAVIRALATSGGKRAVVALGGIVRDHGELQVCTEALSTLARLGGPAATEEITDCFRRTKSRDLRAQCVDALATVRGAAAIPDLLPLLTSEDADLKRVATLILGRLGAPEAMPHLLRAMSNPEGDLFAERAFNQLTWFTATGRSPALRYVEYQKFVETYGKFNRAEWLRLAVRSAKVDTSLLEGWLSGGRLDGKAFAVCLKLLTDASAPLRETIDERLRGLTGLRLPPLAFTASPEEAADRRDVYERWAQGNHDRIEKGLENPLLPAAAESAPSSRP